VDEVWLGRSQGTTATAARKIRSARPEHVREYKGVGGVFTFSPQKHWGLAKNDVVMIEWRQGKFRRARRGSSRARCCPSG
jgi:branched-chain amino acid transport system substrate-binding protein